MFHTHRRHLAPQVTAKIVDSRTPSYETEFHAHDEYMVLMPRSGGMVVRVREEQSAFRINAACMALVAPGVEHATAATRPQQQHLALYVDQAFVEDCARRIGGGKGAPTVLPAPPACGVWRMSPSLVHMLRLREELAGVDAEHRDSPRMQATERLIAAECVTTALTTANALPAHRGRDALLIHEILAYLEAHMAEQLTVDDVAAQFLLSRRHFTRLFRERTGHSMIELLNGKRLERAQRLLQDPQTSVMDAALLVGFETPSYFARLYRLKYGHPPSRR
ncbi:helix-turn-helix domain-containing protein [Roseateles sp. L2-2]|uniref:helix-turn-helix domain-containing protein n=1 Tax=Roseateles sp. L2-2 TaxID=3422597 RepID=UPI003D36B24A